MNTKFHKTGNGRINVSLRWILATTVTVEKQWVYYIFWVCVCSLRYPARNAHAPYGHLWYPARNAHAPYGHLWPVLFYNIFSHYLINGTIFEKKKKKGTGPKKVFFLFSLQLLSETFLITRRRERNMIKNVYWSSSKVPFCPILMKLEFSRQIFDKSSKIKFHANPSSGSRVFPCGRTDMTKLTVAFRAILRAHIKKFFSTTWHRKSGYRNFCHFPHDPTSKYHTRISGILRLQSTHSSVLAQKTSHTLLQRSHVDSRESGLSCALHTYESNWARGGGGGEVLSLKRGEENTFRSSKNAASDVRNVADLSTFHVSHSASWSYRVMGSVIALKNLSPFASLYKRPVTGPVWPRGFQEV
jgi:hypothetical protein